MAAIIVGHPGHPHLASTRRVPGARARSALRAQAASLRALLDEVELLTVVGSVEEGLNGRVVEQLTRLAYRSLEAAGDLAGRGEPERDSCS